ncbi:WD40/YVTN/BNR-like repeat-containing protein, partial [Christiangramia aquimixticola]
NNGVVLKTKDKAVTWEILPFPEKVNLTSVDFWDLFLGFVVGEGGITYQTKDGGLTWVKINSGTIRDLNSVNYGDPNSAFAVGNDGTILSYS